ncbi:hypothetical protein GCM10010412_067210 [Nonomuraea recticatena]|uniref:Uncharacterized protein n=1 Tax=Nonomuraea recticatena TaxID=46178 RepID=A0ABP6F4A6_9ACTN
MHETYQPQALNPALTESPNAAITPGNGSSEAAAAELVTEPDPETSTTAVST